MIYNQNAITLLQKGHNTRISKDAIVTNWKSPKLTEKFEKKSNENITAILSPFLVRYHFQIITNTCVL